jgi:hypothetical protein
MARVLWILAIAALAASCAWRASGYTGPRTITGTCDGACRHYLRCKGESSPNVYGACVQECEMIFVEDDEPDSVSLGMFEQLDCPDAIGFVEGTSGRGPGSEPPALAQ